MLRRTIFCEEKRPTLVKIHARTKQQHKNLTILGKIKIFPDKLKLSIEQVYGAPRKDVLFPSKEAMDKFVQNKLREGYVLKK